MAQLSRFRTKAKEEPAKASNDNTANTKHAAYIIKDALFKLFREDDKGPNVLEALAIALAGDNLEFPIGEQMASIAESFESIAESLERIADAMDEGGK